MSRFTQAIRGFGSGHAEAGGGAVEAVWSTVIASSDRTVVVEHNHYFPPDSVDWELLRASDHETVCPWKGRARYHTITLGGEHNEAAAWSYPDPRPAAAEIKDHVAFWRGVDVRPVDRD